MKKYLPALQKSKVLYLICLICKKKQNVKLQFYEELFGREQWLPHNPHQETVTCWFLFVFFFYIDKINKWEVLLGSFFLFGQSPAGCFQLFPVFMLSWANRLQLLIKRTGMGVVSIFSSSSQQEPESTRFFPLIFHFSRWCQSVAVPLQMCNLNLLFVVRSCLPNVADFLGQRQTEKVTEP